MSPDLFNVIAMSADIPTEFPTLGKALLYVVGSVLFLLLNAFFVASEFAIVKVRGSQIDTASEDYPQRAKHAKVVTGNLDGFLSANQLGITIASLALGFLGEPFVLSLVAPILHKLPAWTNGTFPTLEPEWIKGISWTLAMLSFTFLHVVVGELLPKGIAIRKPLGTTLALAGSLRLFYRGFSWAIGFLQVTANWLLKKCFRIDPLSEGEHVHSSEELALLVTESERSQEVTETERQILINALELNDLSVRDIMTPRSEVIAFDLEDSFERCLEVARQTKHTRFPLVRSHLDNSLGLIHIKDLMKLIGQENPDLMSIRRELKIVPTTMPLDELLKYFLREHAHLALVVDEFGDPTGLVFLDNVLEELVGDIQDEFDNEDSAVTFIGDNEYVVEGGLSLNELADHVEDLNLDNTEVSTIGGYITNELGRFPETGESLYIEKFEAKVTSSDGRRVGQIHLRRLDDDEIADLDLDE